MLRSVCAELRALRSLAGRVAALALVAALTAVQVAVAGGPAPTVEAMVVGRGGALLAPERLLAAGPPRSACDGRTCAVAGGTPLAACWRFTPARAVLASRCATTATAAGSPRLGRAVRRRARRRGEPRPGRLGVQGRWRSPARRARRTQRGPAATAGDPAPANVCCGSGVEVLGGRLSAYARSLRVECPSPPARRSTATVTGYDNEGRGVSRSRGRRSRSAARRRGPPCAGEASLVVPSRAGPLHADCHPTEDGAGFPATIVVG